MPNITTVSLGPFINVGTELCCDKEACVVRDPLFIPHATGSNSRRYNTTHRYHFESASSSVYDDSDTSCRSQRRSIIDAEDWGVICRAFKHEGRCNVCGDQDAGTAKLPHKPALVTLLT